MSDARKRQTRRTFRARLTTFAIGIFVANWFAMFAVAYYLGGNALGTEPTRHGYVVKSKNNKAQVTETQWLFSLAHTTVTMLSFVVAIPWFAWNDSHPPQRVKRWVRFVFATLFGVFMAIAISKEAWKSWSAYRLFKSQLPVPVERN